MGQCNWRFGKLQSHQDKFVSNPKADQSNYSILKTNKTQNESYDINIFFNTCVYSNKLWFLYKAMEEGEGLDGAYDATS